MILDIYEFKDYKEILKKWIDHPANKKVGAKKELAKALACQAPFISHVLNGNYHFSQEQTFACCQWMGLNENETEYFSLLVSWERAGTTHLKNHLNKKIQKLRKEETILKKKVSIDKDLSSESQRIYHSDWSYSAVHMALLNKDLQSLESLQKRFHFTSNRLVKIIDFLMQIGLVEERNGRLKVLNSMIHLEKDSPLTTQHHVSWRLKAIQSLQESNLDSDNDNLHYSGAISLSEDDYAWLKQRLTMLLNDISQKVQNSADEKLICFNFDSFEI